MFLIPVDYNNIISYNKRNGGVFYMGMSTKVKMLLAARGMTIKDIAENIILYQTNEGSGL